MTLEIGAETKEENRYDVERGLNRMLQSLYERGLIEVIKSSSRTVMSFAEGDLGVLRTKPHEIDNSGEEQG